MSVSAKMICDSKGPCGARLTTMELRYPRLVHSELMTHRAFSRNARSSRAVPVARLIGEIRADPVVPMGWGRNRKGMQAGEPLDPACRRRSEALWRDAMEAAIQHAEALAGEGLAKQHVNRLLEPFAHIDVLVTATDWGNFFALRRHPDAQPEMQALAEAMWEELWASEPRGIPDGGWHLPYVRPDEWNDAARVGADAGIPIPVVLARVSAARCRRVSYRPWDGSDASVAADLARFDEMAKARPIHASPMEHQAMATGDPGVRSGNFRGWVQFRQSLRGHDADA